MKSFLFTRVAVCLAALVIYNPVHAADAELGLTLVTELAQVNGVALACQDKETAAKAKKLMLAHAPKTPRFGSAFEESTNASYLAQVRGTTACPDAASLDRKLNALAKRLQDALPPSQPAAQ
jgi:hypothetical protein